MCGSRLEPGEYTPKKKSGSLRRAKPKAPKATKSDKQLAQERRNQRDTLRRNLFRDKNAAKTADATAPSRNQANEEKIERENWEEEYERELMLYWEEQFWEEEEQRRRDEEEEERRRDDDDEYVYEKRGNEMEDLTACGSDCGFCGYCHY